MRIWELMLSSFETILGLFGDTLTFAGGVTLTWKEFKSVKEYKEVEAARRYLITFGIPFVDKRGTAISNAEDLQTSILTRNAKWSRVGAFLITLGFICLLLSRLLGNSGEAHEKSRPEQLHSTVKMQRQIKGS